LYKFDRGTKEASMLRKITGLTALIVLFSIGMAEAGKKIEIQPYGSMRMKSSFGEGWYENDLLEDLSVASGGGFGFTLGIPMGSEGPKGQLGMIELSMSYQESDLRFEPASIANVPDSILERFEQEEGELILGNLNVMYLHVGGLYRFGDFNGWLPFVNGGLGASIFSAPDSEADSKSKFSLSLGTGVARMFNDRLGARLGLKGYFTSLPAEEAYWVDHYGGVWAITDSNWLIQGELSLGLVLRF
jgi:hypothetical protein